MLTKAVVKGLESPTGASSTMCLSFRVLILNLQYDGMYVYYNCLFHSI
jgi:hypothetical protein